MTAHNGDYRPLVATPTEDRWTGEEMEECSECANCGGEIFLDFVEVDDDRWRIQDESCFWQHNDDRYTPGAPSACVPGDLRTLADLGEHRG